MIQNYLALIEQDQPKQEQTQQQEQIKPKENSKPAVTFYRGLACFDTLWEAVQYQRKYEDRLIKSHLRENKGHHNNNKSGRAHNEVKLFVEHSIPSMYQYKSLGG